VSVNGIIKFFQDGGFFLYPLVIIFVVGVAIAVERWVYLTKETIKNRNLWDDVAPHLGAGNFKQAVALANNSTAQIGTVLKYGLARLSTARRRDDIQQAMEESLLEIVPRLEKRTHYLSSLANIGMLIGLLGTIVALIHAFATVSQANPAEKAALLASAISEAYEQHGHGSRLRHHAAAGAHVPRSQDHRADRQPRDRGGEVPEFDHRALLRAGRPAGWWSSDGAACSRLRVLPDCLADPA
jgi:biopolymer transport protein ExbB/TolQ